MQIHDSPFLNCPYEILDVVYAKLDQKEKILLASTCWSFRERAFRNEILTYTLNFQKILGKEYQQGILKANRVFVTILNGCIVGFGLVFSQIIFTGKPGGLISEYIILSSGLGGILLVPFHDSAQDYGPTRKIAGIVNAIFQSGKNSAKWVRDFWLPIAVKIVDDTFGNGSVSR